MHGFAFYFDPAPCRRIVFFGAGTMAAAGDLVTGARTPAFDWAPYSKAYAAWRATAAASSPAER